MPYTDDDLEPGFRLDEEFVRAATVKERSARQRSRTGTVDAAPYFPGSAVPVSGEWNRRLNSACVKVSRTYFSGKVPPGVTTVVMPIEPESWRTGQRTAHCLAVRLDSAYKPIPQTVALLPAQ